jgi:hypothetical protein
MRIAAFLPVSIGESSAGLTTEFVPLQQELNESEHQLEVLLQAKPGSFFNPSKSFIAASSILRPRKSFLPSDLHEAFARLIWETMGRFAPPAFRLTDFAAGFARPWEISRPDAVIAYKPWFRTVVPAKKTARKLGIPDVLWLDDYEIPPSANFLRKFSLLVTNSQFLSEVYRDYHPTYLPHTVETGLIRDFPARDTHRSGSGGGHGRTRVAVLFPGTGFPSQEALSLIYAVSRGLTNAEISIFNFPREYSKIIRRLEIVSGNSCTSSPQVPRSRLIEILDEQTFVIVPQPDSVYGRAKASVRLLECMARGLPIMTPSFGETINIVGPEPCALLYPSRDYARIAECCEKLANDPDFRVKLSCRALARIKKRPSWKENGATLIRELERARPVIN